MTKNSTTWLRSVALLALLQATMAAKCAPDVEMGNDEADDNVGAVGGASAVDPNAKGGVSQVTTASVVKGGAAAVTASVVKGGAAAITASVVKGGAAAITASVVKGGAAAITATVAKGGADPNSYVKCGPEECGVRPEAPPTCTNMPISCEADAAGKCGWKVGECPAKATCDSRLCLDEPKPIDCEGDFGPSRECIATSAGTCVWEQTCPTQAMCWGRCGAEPAERGTCPDGSLKRITCECEGAEKPVFLCSEVDQQKCSWREVETCPLVQNCKGADLVIVTSGWKTKSLPMSSYGDDPAAIEALCEEAYRQPIVGTNPGCVSENRGYGYEFSFIDKDGAGGNTTPGSMIVLPNVGCKEMSTASSGSTTIREPSEALWQKIAKVVGVDLRSL